MRPFTSHCYSSSSYFSCYNKKTSKILVKRHIVNMSGGENESPCFKRPRSVVKKVLAKAQNEGDGAIVRRSFGRPELKNLDPFLLLNEFSVAAPAGFPDHPHRGSFYSPRFPGHKGTIKAGDLQRMTACREIIHSEMPAGGGVHKGLQLWINLSTKHKMIEPCYQELQSKDIAQVEKDRVHV